MMFGGVCSGQVTCQAYRGCGRAGETKCNFGDNCVTKYNFETRKEWGAHAGFQRPRNDSKNLPITKNTSASATHFPTFLITFFSARRTIATTTKNPVIRANSNGM